MYCTQCGHAVGAANIACTTCGERTSLDGKTTSGTIEDSVFGPDPVASNRARDDIIARADVSLMAACARRACSLADAERSNFWFLEWITAEGASEEDIATGVLAYSRDLLITERRYSESELYLAWLSHSRNPNFVAAANSALQELHQIRGANGKKRLRTSGAWRSVDASHPVDPSSPAVQQFETTIALLMARAAKGNLSEAKSRKDPKHLSHVAGLLIAMTTNITRLGGDYEATVQGILEWIDIEAKQAEKAQRKVVASSTARGKPKQSPKDSPRKPAIAENRLGNQIDRLFSDRKLADPIKRALGCTSGLNDDYVVAHIPVSGKLGDDRDYYDQYIIFTSDKVAIVKKSGMFSSGGALTFTKRQVALVGIGASEHYESQGLTGRPTSWVSVTIDAYDGQRFTRHYFLGHNESQVNGNVTKIRGDFERMSRSGWPLGDGPAWNSSGGYRTSYGYSVGIWN